MTLTCPDHGSVTPRLAWCCGEGWEGNFRGTRTKSRLHLGARCPVCNLWLKWLPGDTPCLPSVTVEALR